MKLKEEIKVARAKKNLSQRGLAQLSGVTQQMVSSWEKGEPVAERHWEVIQEEMGIDVSLFSNDVEGDVQTITQTATDNARQQAHTGNSRLTKTIPTLGLLIIKTRTGSGCSQWRLAGMRIFAQLNNHFASVQNAHHQRSTRQSTRWFRCSGKHISSNTGQGALTGLHGASSISCHPLGGINSRVLLRN